MDTRRIKKLIEMVKQTGIGELEVKSGDESVRISCHSGQAPQVVTTHVSAPVPSAASSPSGGGESAQVEAESSAAIDDGYVQKSPMVGTVYLSSTPGAKPFVAIGDRIEEGDTLCLIEAMKMFNKIQAEKSGIVSARLIENEQPVEFDQSLFIIETNE